MWHVRRHDDLHSQRGSVKLQVLTVLLLLLGLTAVWVVKREKEKKRPIKPTPGPSRSESEPVKVDKTKLNPVDSTKALPANTLVYFTFPSLEVLRKEFDKSSMNQLYNEPTVKEFLSGMSEKMGELKTQAQGQLGIGMDMIQKVLGGQVTAAVLGPASAGGGNRLVLMFDMCQNRDQFRDVAATVINKLFPVSPGADGKAGKESEEKVKNDVIRIRQSAPMALAYSYLDDTLVVSPSKEAIREVIATVRGGEGAKPPLAETPGFQAIRDRVVGKGATCVAYAYVSASGLLDRYKDLIGAERLERMQKAGLSSIKAIGYGARFEGEEGSSRHRGVKETLFVYAPKAERKTFAAVLDCWPRGEKKLLSLVPAEALYCSVTRIDVKKLWTSIVEALGAFNREASAGMEQFVELVNKESGVDFKNEFLECLGDEMATIALPENRDKNRKSATIFVMTLANSQKAEQCIPKVLVSLLSLSHAVPPSAPAPAEKTPKGPSEQKPDGTSPTEPGKTPPAAPPAKDKETAQAPPVKLQFDPSTYNNKRIYVLRTPGDMPFVPAYCITGNMLIISNGAEGVRTALDGLTGAGPLLVDDGDFKEVGAHLAKENSAISYFDFKEGSSCLYARAKTLGMDNLGDLGIPLDLKRLPDVQVFEKHFFGVAACVASDDAGVAFESYSPLGSVGTVIGAAMIVGSLTPGINVKDICIRWTCKQHLTEVGKAMRAYAKAHEGNLPEPGSQPKELVDGKFTTTKVFYCPATGAEPASFPDGMGYQFTILDYSIAPVAEEGSVHPDTGQLIGFDHRLPIAWDKKGNHAEGRHVLFLDGHVEFLSEEAFVRALENPRQ